MLFALARVNIKEIVFFKCHNIRCAYRNPLISRLSYKFLLKAIAGGKIIPLLQKIENGLGIGLSALVDDPAFFHRRLQLIGFYGLTRNARIAYSS